MTGTPCTAERPGPNPASTPGSSDPPASSDAPSSSTSESPAAEPSPSESSAAESSPSESSPDDAVHRGRALWRLLARRVRGYGTGRLLVVALVALVFAGSIWVMAHELRGFEYAEVGAYLSDLPPVYVLLALGVTAVNFVVLSGYDALALRYVDASLPYRRVAFSAFVGYAVSQAVGNPILTGGSVRYRLYSSWGLSGEQIAKAVVFAGASFWLGFFTLGSVLFLLEPVLGSLPASLSLPVAPPVVGAVCLVPMLGYLGLTTLTPGTLDVRGWTVDVPPRWMLPVQVGLAATDLLLATTVLFVLLPPGADVSFAYLLGVYLVALLAGLVSHVPGGLGVFDSIVLLMLTPVLPAPTVLGALLAYRGIFHLVPLVLAALGFTLYEARRGFRAYG